MNHRFEGKNCLVTGAGSGMGKATAIRLAEEGGQVWCTDINAEGLAETVKVIKEAGGTAESSIVDVTDYDAVEKLVAEFIDAWGSMHVLCNIAGIGGMTRFEDLTPDKFRLMLAVNLEGPYNFCKASISHLLESKGNIVNMASTAGLIGQAYVSAYVASKHGLIGLTKSLAMEFGKRGVRANAICPGAINTPLINDFAAFPEGVEMDLVMRYNFLPYFAEPSEVGAMVAYVASDEARYVNGAIMSIDGGITTG